MVLYFKVRLMKYWEWCPNKEKSSIKKYNKLNQLIYPLMICVLSAIICR